MAISTITTANTFAQLVATINTVVDHINTLDARPAPINWYGDWAANTSYVLNAVVASNSMLWIALETNINIPPTALTISTWDRML